MMARVCTSSNEMLGRCQAGPPIAGPPHPGPPSAAGVGRRPRCSRVWLPPRSLFPSLGRPPLVGAPAGGAKARTPGLLECEALMAAVVLSSCRMRPDVRVRFKLSWSWRWRSTWKWWELPPASWFSLAIALIRRVSTASSCCPSWMRSRLCSSRCASKAPESTAALGVLMPWGGRCVLSHWRVVCCKAGPRPCRGDLRVCPSIWWRRCMQVGRGEGSLPRCLEPGCRGDCLAVPSGAGFGPGVVGGAPSGFVR